MLSKDIGIDLGTANVLIHVKGKGVVLDEPSVVTLESDTKKVLAVGEQARRMVGRTPGNISTIRPLRDGVIADFEITETMLKYFIDRVGGRSWYSRPRILICAPTNITSVEQKSIREAAERSGAKEVFMEEEPKAAAIGAGMDIYQPSGNMVVDIGGGTTDVAVLSMGDVVTASSIKIAGDKFDEAILKYIKQKYKLLIGERTAEDIKLNIGNVRPGGTQAEMDIRGRDMVSGLPQTLTISSAEVQEALWDPVSSIVIAAKTVLERTPPELSADIIDRGVVLTGGGALLTGLDELLAEELHVPVWVAEDPMHCVVKGTGIMLDHLDRVVKKKF
ncbi:rod shape-determining protein [Paenibacillus sp. HN-1]|uniref:rod shape-determining protein n=1 Tax=Paenibacillus TaxID=44249 RepID=UPI001CA94B33|nr:MULTISPECIES: rod shape-determining protein [Paenibacillus]MBY9077636.1 rod shape-determining protein [Paenibacillus sp. CGMCC 1.18879]MBY9087439.1 rod shape-determining protein [Paenibacillus sinensis]